MAATATHCTGERPIMTRSDRSLLAAVLCSGGVLITGACGGSGDAPPVPPVPAVPAVPAAKDARGQDPCGLLTAERATQFGLPARGTATSVEEGPRCEWSGTGPTSLTITLYTTGGGLATLAANSEPTTTRVRIEGYPALETFTGRGEFCQYDVAMALNQVVMASMENGAPESCTALQSVLPAVLSGLPPYQA